MSLHKLRAVFRDLDTKSNEAREKALFEVAELKQDLNELQRYLSGRKKDTNIVPDDVIRSAFDFAHHFRAMQDRLAILESMKEELAAGEALEYLESRGAKMYKKPAGWHWTSSQDKRYLLDAEDPVKAAAKLRKLLASGKRRKKK